MFHYASRVLVNELAHFRDYTYFYCVFFEESDPETDQISVIFRETDQTSVYILTWVVKAGWNTLRP